MTFLVIDSQLLGNYDKFGLQSLAADAPCKTEAEAEKMLAWLSDQGSGMIAGDPKAPPRQWHDQISRRNHERRQCTDQGDDADTMAE